jgi:hypothetical protein
VGEVGREPQYEAFADEFLPHAGTGLLNALDDRAACLELLGDVRAGTCSTPPAGRASTPRS